MMAVEIRWIAWAALWIALPAAAEAPEEYAKLCAGCHGTAATGTERGPALLDNRSLRSRSEKQIQDLIRTGSGGGMPAFPLPEERLQPLARWVRSLNASANDLKPPGDAGAGERVFFGKGQCATCHVPPYYTDNLMHNLRAERFYPPQRINNMMASADGPIKTFPLRGIKDSPPYLHDDRLLTLEDTVEFFNLVLGVKLSDEEKSDLVAFLRVL